MYEYVLYIAYFVIRTYPCRSIVASGEAVDKNGYLPLGAQCSNIFLCRIERFDANPHGLTSLWWRVGCVRGLRHRVDRKAAQEGLPKAA